MRKTTFTIIVFMLCIMNAAAQRQVAVLSHGEDVKAFYGERAYQQAMAEANHGDVITLSSGIFEAVRIDKAVTVRGAGMENDPVTGSGATHVNGDYAVGIDHAERKLVIEGICFNGSMHVWGDGCLDYVLFNKCKFTRDAFQGALWTADSVMVKCVLTNCKTYRITNNQPSLEAYNSYIGQAVQGHFYNCVLGFGGSGHGDDFKNCHVYNSVALATGHVYFLEKYNVSFSNSIIAGTYDFDGDGNGVNMAYFHFDCPSNGVKLVEEQHQNMFTISDYDWIYKKRIDFDFLLADKYNNDDIGMYGGVTPYSPILNVPTITSFKVDRESDKKGILGVEVEVSGVK